MDWDRDGNFSETNHDITAYVQQLTFNVGFWQPFMEVADEMTCTMTLFNATKRFSPEYSAGPLYAFEWSLRPVRVTAQVNVVDGSGNFVIDGSGNFVVTQTVMWTGWTDEIRPSFNEKGDLIAIMTCHGPKQFLQGAKAYIPLQIDKRTDEIIEVLLDEVRLPPATANGPWALGVVGFSELGTKTYLQNQGLNYSLETGRETIPYAGDTWEDGINVLDAIAQTVQDERGRFFFDRSGNAVFWNRHHMLLKSSVDATITNAVMGASYAYGENMRNVVEVKFKPRAVDSIATTLWTSTEEVTIERDETKEIQARFSEQDSDSKISAIDVVKPSTAAGTLTFQNRTAVLTGWEVDAKGAKMTFTNSAGTDVIITLITITGKRLTAYNEALVTERDGTSVFKRGERTLSLRLPMLSAQSSAEAIAKYELARRKDPEGEMINISLRAIDDTNTNLMLGLTVGSRITLTEAQTGHSADYIIVGEAHQVRDGLILHDVTWTLEAASRNNFWVLGVSTLGVSTVLAPL